MKRDLYKQLLLWKKDPDRQPLLVQGARQVGKTYLLKEFGFQEYKNCCYINFEEMPACKTFFEPDLNPDRILRDLGIHLEMKIDPATTLIIFDEIQECPHALTSLKYFCEQAPEYSVVAAGSLLGVKLSGARGFPVGKVHFCHLFPMTFFEFLDAIGRPMLRTLLEEIKTFEPIAEAHHQQLLELLKIYFYVGGMPKPVLRYVQTKDLNMVREIQEDILKAYVHDFAKHAPPSLVIKITQIWDSIPIHLGKENKKFVFSAIKKSARARDYEESLQWLVDAELIYKAYQVSTPKLPLKSYGDREAFKVYLLDVGLLGAMCRLPARVIVEGDLFFVEFKGSFTENYVAQALKAADENPLYYWTSEREAEVDFLLEKEGRIFPLEVKSGTSTKKKSLLVYQEKYHSPVLSRSSLMNLKKDGNLCNYPLYYMNRFPMEISPDNN
ncbi:MAG: ATP-binding protein [Chlamydiales bacterium]|nr:ATP-binding protein [Chlamydiales bacterium]